MVLDRITRGVSLMYSRYPFPDRHVPGFHYATHLKRHLPRRPRVRILDAGCGTGEHSLGAAKLYPWAHVVALDISLDSVRRGQALAHSEGVTNVSFLAADLMCPVPLRGPFDAIMAVGVIHHLADPGTGLRNLTAALAPQGVMLVYLYGALGRWDLGLKQQIVRLLEPDPLCFEQRLRIARELGLYQATPRSLSRRAQDYRRWLSHLPWRERFQAVARRLRRRRSFLPSPDGVSDAVLMDQVAHVNEVRFRVREVLRLIRETGLELVAFLDEMARPLGEFTRSQVVLARASQLGEEDLLELKELFVRPGSFTFLARRSGS